MTTQRQADRRQDTRFYESIPVKISSEDFDFVTETINLSRSGVYCRIDKYVEPMTKLKIHLLLPFKRDNKIVTKKVSFHGIIVRTESVPDKNTFNVAIYFNEISKRDVEIVADFVSQVMEKKENGIK